MKPGKRKLSYFLLAAAYVLHFLALVLPYANGFSMFIAGVILLIVSLWLNPGSHVGKREEFYWVPAIGCIFLSVFTLFMYIIGFAVVKVWSDLTA